MVSELLGSIWRWGLSPYKDWYGPTQQMREHRDRGAKAERGSGDEQREGAREERAMEGAAHQRTPRECLAQSLKESQENRLGVRFSPGAKTQAAFFFLPRAVRVSHNSYFCGPSLTCPSQNKSMREALREKRQQEGRQWDRGVRRRPHISTTFGSV